MSRLPQSHHLILIVLNGRKALERSFGIRGSGQSANDDRHVRAITLLSQWKRVRRRYAQHE